MFGGELKLPKPPKPRERPCMENRDIFMPDAGSTGRYAHMGRNPNTNYATALLHYRQRAEEMATSNEKNVLEGSSALKLNIEFIKKTERKRFRNDIQNRLQSKWIDYEKGVERRRELLKDMLATEEREFIRETVEQAQKADDNKLEDMKKKCAMLREVKEIERQKIVEQKRFQQYADRSIDLRPYLTKKNLIESKLCQQQQMRENESRREAEREIDMMWNHVMEMQDIARMERETQDALMRYEVMRDQTRVWELQIQGKKVMEEERRLVELSNRKELEALQKRVQRQEEEDLLKKRLAKEKEVREVKEQMRLQLELAAQRKREEDALENAFRMLAELEYEKEKAKMQNLSARRKREVAMYRAHLEQLDKHRKEEEAKLDELLSQYQKAVIAKETEKQCKIKEAKLKLQEQVMAERAQQIAYKKEQAQKELQYQKDENVMLSRMLDLNEKLDIEAARQAKEDAVNYRSDLQKQIEYNNLLREREHNEIQKMLEKGIEQEKKFQAFIDEIISGSTSTSFMNKHPFRVVLERYDCHCPKENDKPKVPK